MEDDNNTKFNKIEINDQKFKEQMKEQIDDLLQKDQTVN